MTKHNHDPQRSKNPTRLRDLLITQPDDDIISDDIANDAEITSDAERDMMPPENRNQTNEMQYNRSPIPAEDATLTSPADIRDDMADDALGDNRDDIRTQRYEGDDVLYGDAESDFDREYFDNEDEHEYYDEPKKADYHPDKWA